MSRKAKSHFCQANYPAEYACWTNMKQRCFNPRCNKYDNYGNRGITVCARWRESFHNFMEDMGPRPPKHSLDRIDVDGDYEPENCRWADAKSQGGNKRSPLRRAVEHKAERDARTTALLHSIRDL